MPEIILVGVLLLLGMGAYWAMVLFPKQRDYQKRQRFVSEMQAGDEVITYGGVIGRIVEVVPEQGIAFVEIADGVVVRMINAAIMQPYDPEEIAKNARIGLGLMSDMDEPTA